MILYGEIKCQSLIGVTGLLVKVNIRSTHFQYTINNNNNKTNNNNDNKLVPELYGCYSKCYCPQVLFYLPCQQSDIRSPTKTWPWKKNSTKLHKMENFQERYRHFWSFSTPPRKVCFTWMSTTLANSCNVGNLLFDIIKIRDQGRTYRALSSVFCLSQKYASRKSSKMFRLLNRDN